MSSELVTGAAPVPLSPCDLTGKRSTDAAAFCGACARFATGVAIVSLCDDAGQPHGMTVNSFTSVSLDPILFLVAIDHKAGVLPLFRDGMAIAINVLSDDQRELSVRFARPGQDRFGTIEWTPGVTGAPLLPGVLATLEGTVVRMIVAGDHTLMLAQVHAANHREGRPLIYFGSSYERLGETLP